MFSFYNSHRDARPNLHPGHKLLQQLNTLSLLIPPGPASLNRQMSSTNTKHQGIQAPGVLKPGLSTEDDTAWYTTHLEEKEESQRCQAGPAPWILLLCYCFFGCFLLLGFLSCCCFFGRICIRLNHLHLGAF